MARYRATRRRLALVPDHERRLVDGHEGVAARRADGNDAAAGLFARADASGIPLPPPVPTTKVTPTPQPAVNIPSSTVSIIPVTCAIVGTFVVCAAVFFFWYRKQRRKKEVNKRNTWYDPSKFNNKATLSIEPAPATTSSTDKPAATAYPPRKVSATPRATPRSGAPAPSPLRNQTNGDSKNKPSAPKPTTSAAPSASAGPLSPVSPGPTPSEKTAFNPNPISSPPVAATNRFSFLKDASKLPPSFQAQEAPRVQPMKRSASLLSSRMSTRRKPQRQDTAPAAPSEADAPIIPSLRITDADSPLEDAKAPAHPLEGKLVTVVDQYDATMPDELGVTPGETLRVIEAYDDDWCLAERVGRKKGRGILPQIVVAEKGSLRANTRFSTLMREGQ